MNDDVYIPSHHDRHGAEGLDNPLRVIVVVNLPGVPEGQMEERMLDAIQVFDEVDAFFDEFDEKVAIPNKDHIKYEVGSDGLVIFVVDSLEMQAKVLKFIDDFSKKIDEDVMENCLKNGDEAEEIDNDYDESVKKRAKSS